MTTSPVGCTGSAGSDAAVERIQAELVRVRDLIGDLGVELAGIAESTAAGPDDEHDAEGSTVGYERARVQALLAYAERRGAELQAAADRVESGAAPLECERCHGLIGAERLLALPATRTCVDCAGRPR